MSVPFASKKTSADVAPPQAKRQVSRKEMLGIVLVLAGAMVLFPAIRWLTGGSDVEPTHLTEISPRELQVARQLWKQKGPPNYNLEMELVAPANRTNLQLEVRGGVATKLVKNGAPVTRQEDLDQWTIEGQFDQIAKYIAMDTSEAARTAGWTMRNVGRFDDERGYPADYSRQGTGHQVKYHITVTKFEEVQP